MSPFVASKTIRERDDSSFAPRLGESVKLLWGDLLHECHGSIPCVLNVEFVMRTDVSTERIRIGISGWRYTPWRGEFYPESLPQRLELAYASRLLATIELNGSFYSLQRPEYYTQWFEETPPDFEFAVKGPRFITHTIQVLRRQRWKDLAEGLNARGLRITLCVRYRGDFILL